MKSTPFSSSFAMSNGDGEASWIFLEAIFCEIAVEDPSISMLSSVWNANSSFEKALG
ncbi:hypothetical protein CC2G_013035 [Coprinopsis cinerea AmutBmut pab1-1]|nr:hypothetical protein CC2G_013035 [Coprinopsis cinerea AmutBmut pab1-1]